MGQVGGGIVSADAPANGGVVNAGPLGADLSGILPNPTVIAVQGQAWSTTAPVFGDVARWDGSKWEPFAGLHAPDFAANLTDVFTVAPSTSPVTYLTLGKAAAVGQAVTTTTSQIVIDPAGVYLLDGSFTLQTNTNNTNAWVSLLFNGAPPPKGPFVLPLSKANAQIPFAIISRLPGAFFPPLLDLTLRFARDSGSGDIGIRSAYLGLGRLS